MVDLENAEVALRVERRKVKALQKELEQRQLQHVKAAEIEEVFLYWRQVLRGDSPRVKLGTKRRKVIAGRLDDGHTVQDIKDAIDGASFDAFVGANGVRHDDIELICRDEVKLENFIARGRAVRERKLKESLPSRVESLRTALEVLSGGARIDDYGRARFKCPCCRAYWDDPMYRPLLFTDDDVSCDACGAEIEQIYTTTKELA